MSEKQCPHSWTPPGGGITHRCCLNAGHADPISGEKKHPDDTAHRSLGNYGEVGAQWGAEHSDKRTLAAVLQEREEELSELKERLRLLDKKEKLLKQDAQNDRRGAVEATKARAKNE